jgi:hypothetical protein
MIPWGQVIQAQQMFLDSVRIYSPIIDSTYLHHTVEYDQADFNVSSFNHHASNTGDVSLKYLFENDTVVKWIHVFPGDTAYYDHLGDTIFFNLPGFDSWYLVNEEYQIVATSKGDTLDWADDNLLEKYGMENTAAEYSYTNFANPYFNIWRTFKLNHEASYNQVEYIYFPNDNYYRYEVIDSQHNYPTEIDRYAIDPLGNETFIGTYYFYFTTILDVPEIPTYSRVFSVSYYNLLGQQIEKPKSGFYIERKVTDNGIISTKHFLP